MCDFIAAVRHVKLLHIFPLHITMYAWINLLSMHVESDVIIDVVATVAAAAVAAAAAAEVTL